jgi:hypothetical protein
MARFKLKTHEPDTGNAAAIAITAVPLSRTRPSVDWTGLLLWKIHTVDVSLPGDILRQTLPLPHLAMDFMFGRNKNIEHLFN